MKTQMTEMTKTQVTVTQETQITQTQVMQTQTVTVTQVTMKTQLTRTQETQLMETQDGRNEGDGRGRRMEAESEVGEVWNDAGTETRICGSTVGGATAGNTDGAWANGDGLDNGGGVAGMSRECCRAARSCFISKSASRPVKNRAVRSSGASQPFATKSYAINGGLLVDERLEIGKGRHDGAHRIKNVAQWSRQNGAGMRIESLGLWEVGGND
ncbi:hypothetical protein BD779DRAFT_1793535 [Infundibulicybe gibba]|nr:hypothetical protein BD779DRAFT_1793535 [Infundibulicybe gibba]